MLEFKRKRETISKHYVEFGAVVEGFERFAAHYHFVVVAVVAKLALTPSSKDAVLLPSFFLFF